MPKTKISEFSSTPANNTDIDSINISEGCAPSGINDAIRELMAQLKDFQTGAVGDSFNGPVGTTTAAAGAFTTVTATSAATTNSEARSVIKLADTSSVAQGNGGGLLFRGVYTGTTLVDAAGVQAYKANATDNDYSYGLAFVTRANGGNLTANMKLDQSGNLGLGVTPSAWGLWSSVVQGGSYALTSYNNGSGNVQAALWCNGYRNSGGTNTYYSNGYATQYVQANGTHGWTIAPSGTAGNAITFTQAMTLDASGNLLVGTTSATYSASGRGLVEVNGSSTSLLALKTGGSAAGYVYHDGTEMSVVNTKAGSLQLTTNGTERARIDSSGNLLVGQTSTGLKTTRSMGFTISGACVQQISHSTSDGNGDSYVEFGYNGTKIGSITQNGTTAVAYNTSSDYRLKNTIAPMTGALAKVAQLKPVTYKWNADGSDGEGFIAHELAEVCPDAVTGEKDAVDAEGNPQYQGIDVSFLVATLTAALQEQQAIIESLKARLDAANL